MAELIVQFRTVAPGARISPAAQHLCMRSLEVQLSSQVVQAATWEHMALTDDSLSNWFSVSGLR